METSSFFYYTPDPSPAGQHGHFLPHPNVHSTSEQSTMTESSSLPYPSALVPPRPSSAQLNIPLLKTSPTMVHAPTPVNSSLSPPVLKKNSGLLTPCSPTLSGLDGNEICFFPPTPIMENALTPPMSAVNAQWSFDEHCGGAMTPLDLQIPETPEHWRNTPPVTPVYTYPPSLMPSNAPCPSILLSACPSLSPSSEHSSSPEFDFCDPRHLTYPTPTPLTPLDCESESDFPMTAVIGEDNESSFSIHTKLEDKGGFSFFDGFDDFESDEDLANFMLPTTIDTSFLINKREEPNVDEYEMFDDDFDVFSDNDSQFEEQINAILNPEPQPTRRNTVSASKKQKTQKRKNAKRVKAEPCDSDLDIDNIVLLAKQNGIPEDVIEMEYLTPTSCRSEKSVTPYPSDCSEHSHGHLKDAPVVRRGRKQSLTDDPSKTFVCNLCSRRFRRQEHLKRHFRSLHTQDKPFSCGECGKRFSRSDNLSQHARTHGSGAIVMGVLEDTEMHEDDGHLSEEDTPPRNLVFIDTSEKKSRRKRKRDE